MTARDPARYVGRFAPTPSGPLHLGSLVAAAASYLEARRNNGLWLLRIEDIDPPREKPGAAAAIVRDLEILGFEWDGPVRFQSNSKDAHEEALAELLSAGQAYRCDCSRTDLAEAPRGPLGPVYPGTCRNRTVSADAAVRVRTTGDPIEFVDRLQGPQVQYLERDSGDFVIFRRDGLVAYHLAVVVDDALEGITDIVRGSDLLDSTPRQIWLQRLLGFATPGYAHIPVILGPDGEKLSKSLGSGAVDTGQPSQSLFRALEALQQAPPAELARSPVGEIWDWAFGAWRLERLAGLRTLPLTFDRLSP